MMENRVGGGSISTRCSCNPNPKLFHPPTCCLNSVSALQIAESLHQLPHLYVLFDLNYQHYNFNVSAISAWDICNDPNLGSIHIAPHSTDAYMMFTNLFC